MKNLASMFTEEAQEALQEHLGIKLSDEHDYSPDEIEDLYERITDDFPYSYDADGNPLRLGQIFESIIDVFTANNQID